MNIYIDFEASQYTQEIISVGAISSSGEEFYSLVNTSRPVGKVVEGLTGIKQQDITDADQPNIVFEDFFFWLQDVSNNGNKKVRFICYGNSDLDFAKNTLKKTGNSLYAEAALSMIICNMVDYAEYTKDYFGLARHISLLKLARFYSHNENLQQNHNSLDDAKLLKFIYEKIQEGNDLVENPFLEYMQKIEIYDNDNNLIETFYGMGQAIKWVIDFKHMSPNASKKKIANKIIAVSQSKEEYCGFNWVMIN